MAPESLEKAQIGRGDGPGACRFYKEVVEKMTSEKEKEDMKKLFAEKWGQIYREMGWSEKKVKVKK